MTNMTTISHKANYPALPVTLQVKHLAGLEIGHHPTSPYVTKFWSPLLEPDAFALWQQLTARLVLTGIGGFAASPQELGDNLGFTTGPTPTVRLQKALAKLEANNLAQISDNVISVVQAIPNLSTQQLQGLPYGLKTAHKQIEDAAMWAHCDPTHEAHAQLLGRAMTERGFCHADINAALQCLGVDPHAIAGANIHPFNE